MNVNIYLTEQKLCVLFVSKTKVQNVFFFLRTSKIVNKQKKKHLQKQGCVSHTKNGTFLNNGFDILPVGSVGNGKHVRRHFMAFLALIEFDDLLCVDRQSLIGVDHYAKQTRICLQESERKLG